VEGITIATRCGCPVGMVLPRLSLEVKDSQVLTLSGLDGFFISGEDSNPERPSFLEAPMRLLLVMVLPEQMKDELSLVVASCFCF
jgi:hypothetical protein